MSRQSFGCPRAVAGPASVLVAAAAVLLPVAALAFEPVDLVEVRSGPADAPDSAMVVPLEQYMAGMYEAPDELDPDAPAKLRFPLVSALRRGVLAAPVKAVVPARWMGAPVIVLGADEASVKWLRHNLRSLVAMRAMGIVIQADTAQAFQRLQALGEGIPLAPARGRWLSQHLAAADVPVYPVLIQADGSVVQIVPSETSQATP